MTTVEKLNVSDESAVLKAKALEAWAPVWGSAFVDTQYGGFHERLDNDLQPMDMGYKRLLTQCRQIYLYSHASLLNPENDFKAQIKQGFDFLVQNYHVPETGGWRFSVTPDSQPKDNAYDLYGHAFVLFAMGFYHRATKDPQALVLAEKTLDFIDRNFRHPSGGLHECLDENLQPMDKVRRQNPHMHLFEASLFMYETTQNPKYLKMADEVYGLFSEHFFDPETKTLGEFFTEELEPHPEQGHIIEPGHHFEWIWLLDKYNTLKKGDISAEVNGYMEKLFCWADEHSYDSQYGGIYNELDRAGAPLNTDKRIWHVAEALKANAIMAENDRYSQRCETRVLELQNLLTRYIGDKGTWTEILNRDLSPQSDFMPGTTPYHIFMGVAETAN